MIGEKNLNRGYSGTREGKTVYSGLKRFFDVLIAYILLIPAYPVMILISVIIFISSGAPVIFKQTRIGYRGESFVCYKFRTMRNEAPRNMPTSGFKDAGSYITPFGRFLRKTSLDELPQLFNVLAGDMSLIGPRPLIPDEKEVHQRRAENGVYSVRPGITGMAQISGRDLLSDEEKVSLDISYVQHLSFLTDIRIVLLTFTKVFRADGISDAGRIGKEVKN